ncbi:uncharacterized protein PV07_06538 [Cladophialophora immunda]|uniref:Uncharacterized protein n=1 Tax=Cladophialophora immunda TaxID=569365 RepID=A0A0D2ANQ3_9EURO|nr:uncharacterized protein PV07_06538 [Cladophialophora immunda]KIW26727.1 hypothetical protein PV07_06538 [Cladophialophora immunda]OQV02000.1 hypothetical protein CLAIMM_07262 isoform 1 [Cladophialophora immunda]OQV02001.1 hypothetical protein CLAIMM_07262 isoform 2 [Cladophialophora immunda]OQV02002.1 hypothetical protein CLAIMM_07262 isoform 3 [Cladophialophora immunda]
MSIKGGDQPRRPLGLLDLPAEVRHQIYAHLFCHKPSPITLGFHDFFTKWAATWSPFEGEQEAPHEPTFHTALFRVNKAISRDALQFAYGANSFRSDKDIQTFCALGPVALASIKTLRVYRNAWLNSSYATSFWRTLDQRCPGLELLVVEAASHILLAAIPYLNDFMASIPRGQRKPKLVLDLNVWDRHFSFDFPDRDYQSALQDLRRNMLESDWKEFLDPYIYVMRMPRHVQEIRFALDLGPGALRALEEVLRQSTDLCFVEADQASSSTGGHLAGRGKYRCLVWKETGE